MSVFAEFCSGRGSSRVKSSRPINLLHPGLIQGLVSVHITETSIPGAEHPTGAFMNNWCCPEWVETTLCLCFHLKAMRVFINVYKIWGGTYKMLVLQSQMHFVCTQHWLHIHRYSKSNDIVLVSLRFFNLLNRSLTFTWMSPCSGSWQYMSL